MANTVLSRIAARLIATSVHQLAPEPAALARTPTVARIFGADEYHWMKHEGGKLTLQTSKGPLVIDKGEVYGVRPSSNGKQIRFVQAEDHGINKVMTLTLEDAKKLAKTAKPTKEPA